MNTNLAVNASLKDAATLLLSLHLGESATEPCVLSLPENFKRIYFYPPANLVLNIKTMWNILAGDQNSLDSQTAAYGLSILIQNKFPDWHPAMTYSAESDVNTKIMVYDILAYFALIVQPLQRMDNRLARKHVRYPFLPETPPPPTNRTLQRENLVVYTSCFQLGIGICITSGNVSSRWNGNLGVVKYSSKAESTQRDLEILAIIKAIQILKTKNIANTIICFFPLSDHRWTNNVPWKKSFDQDLLFMARMSLAELAAEPLNCQVVVGRHHAMINFDFLASLAAQNLAVNANHNLFTTVGC